MFRDRIEGPAAPASRRRNHATVTLVALLTAALVLSACAADANPQVGAAVESGEAAGFWLGLWHGVIAPVAFVVSLFSDGIGIYEVRNSGTLYDLGFVLGLGFLVGGGSSGARGAKR